MKSYILVQLADGTYKNVDTQDIEQIFKNNLGGETVIFKDGWGIKSERMMVSSSSNPIQNKEMKGVKMMSGTGKINDFVPIGTSLVGEVTFHGKVTGKNNKDEQIERLQEQLSEANHISKYVFISDAYYKSKRAQYLKKWGVK